MSKIKLIATDLDGTLLNHQHRMTDYTKNAWKKIQKSGIHILPVTGRTYSGMCSSVPYELCEFSINTNGVHIFKNINNIPSNIWDKSLSWDLALQVFTLIEEKFPQLHVQAYVGEALYSREENERTAEYTSRSGIEFCVVDKWTDITGSSISKIMVLSGHDELIPLANTLQEYSGISAVFSMPMYLEVFSNTASKGKALLHIAEILGISSAEILGIGDSYNDVPMLEVCKHAYVMANADSKVAPHLPRTEYDNNNDGVIKQIEKLLKI